MAPIGRSLTRSGIADDRPRIIARRRFPAARRLAARDRLADDALAERHAREHRDVLALGGDRLEQARASRRARRRRTSRAPTRLITISTMIFSTSATFERRVELVARRRRGSRGCCSLPRSRRSAMRTAGSLPRASAGARARRCARPRGYGCALTAPGAASTHSPESWAASSWRDSTSTSRRRRRSFSSQELLRELGSAPEQRHELVGAIEQIVTHRLMPLAFRALAREAVHDRVRDLVQRQYRVHRTHANRLMRHAEDHRRLFGLRDHVAAAPLHGRAHPPRRRRPCPSARRRADPVRSASRPRRTGDRRTARKRSAASAGTSRATTLPARASSSRCRPPGATRMLPGSGVIARLGLARGERRGARRCARRSCA